MTRKTPTPFESKTRRARWVTRQAARNQGTEYRVAQANRQRSAAKMVGADNADLAWLLRHQTPEGLAAFCAGIECAALRRQVANLLLWDYGGVTETAGCLGRGMEALRRVADDASGRRWEWGYVEREKVVAELVRFGYPVEKAEGRVWV
jgi:hypothetical protein